jgi:CheY-like chemotaxis protein
MRLVLNLLAVSASPSPVRSASQAVAATGPGVLPIVLAALIVVLLILILVVRFGGRRTSTSPPAPDEGASPVAPHTPDDGVDPNQREIYVAQPRPLATPTGMIGAEAEPEPEPPPAPAPALTPAHAYQPPSASLAPEIFPDAPRTPWVNPSTAAAAPVIPAPPAFTPAPAGSGSSFAFPSPLRTEPAVPDMNAIEPVDPPSAQPSAPTPPNGTPPVVTPRLEPWRPRAVEPTGTGAIAPPRADQPPPLASAPAAFPAPTLVPPSPSVEAPGPEASPTVVPGAAPGEAELILLIEDDERIAKFYTILFQAKGFRVENARDGVEGVDMAQSLKPDLILLDVMMPKMNGLMVLQTLRANPDTEKTPVVVLSNYMEPPLIQRALQLGAIEYVVKSQARPEQLVSALPSWLKGEPALH